MNSEEVVPYRTNRPVVIGEGLRACATFLAKLFPGGSQACSNQCHQLALKSLVLLFLLCIPSFALSQGTGIKCEVLDVGGPPKSHVAGELGKVRYMLIHHARVEDRKELSRYFKGYKGKEITFLVNGKSYKGVIYRLPCCFGRGLILYTEDIGVKKKDEIEIYFPKSKQ